MIVRYEPWGAWVKLETMPALVALDREGCASLGLDGGARWSDEKVILPGGDAPKSEPIEVHLAVTSRCAVGCEGCYLDARPDGIEPPREDLIAALDDLAKRGVFTVAFGGGEPTLRDDLDVLAEHARSRGITPVLTTSGLGLGAKKIDRLRAFAQVNVSYDGPSALYEAVRGTDRAAEAEDAIARLAAAGINVGVNVVLTRQTFDALEATLARARMLGAREAQLLRYKPQGRAKTLDYLAKRLTPKQARSLGPLLRSLTERTSLHGERSPGLRLRIDCALVPFLSADPDLSSRPEDLAQWGIFGCEAGAALGARRIDGREAPCSFAEPDTRDAFRAFLTAPPEPCASCTLRSVCRGGCKVVSAYVDGVIGSDPECPRVRAARSS